MNIFLKIQLLILVSSSDLVEGSVTLSDNFSENLFFRRDRPLGLGNKFNVDFNFKLFSKMFCPLFDFKIQGFRYLTSKNLLTEGVKLK